MALRRNAAMRNSDFVAGIWFKPSSQGGLDRITYHRSIREAWVRFGFEEPLDAFFFGTDEWISPGLGYRCYVSISQWNDEDRRNKEVGESFELLTPLQKELSGPPRCIGLGRIIQFEDPYGRRFYSDARVKVVLDNRQVGVDVLNGVRVRLWFPRLSKNWEGHLDRGSDGNELSLGSRYLWLCFHDLWTNHTQFPGSGHPICIEDVFDIFEFDSDQKLGRGAIVAWEKRNVCYPDGWREGSGVDWRNSFSG